MLLTPEQKQFIRDHEREDVHELALRHSRADILLLLSQIKGRQVARRKIPSWYDNEEILYPPHISMEQASSEDTARYKASLFPEKNGRFVDLTGGLGVDFAFLSSHFDEGIYVEQNKELCEIADHNFKILRLVNVTIKNEESVRFLHQMPRVDMIYLDPSRRDGVGRKVSGIADCSPNVLDMKHLLSEKAGITLIKYSPMLDISLALEALENVYEVHIVSVDNECRELMFLLSGHREKCRYHTINLRENGKTERFSFYPDEEHLCKANYVTRLGAYLYEPNASVLKAGAFNLISEIFTLHKLHKNSHLYTSDQLIPDFPGRIFYIKSVFGPNSRNIRQYVSETKKANVSVRNYPVSVAEIRKNTGLKEGGDTYLFATTLSNKQKVWIDCVKVN